jgi:hypothetical protein
MLDPAEWRQLQDEREIQRVLAEYCLRLEVNPFDDWMELFTDDTVYEVHRRVLRGRREVAEVLSLAPHGVHIGGALRIELDGDTANTLQNYQFLADEQQFSNNGWYYRTLVRTAVGWKIAQTTVKMQKRKKPEPVAS